MGLAARGTIQGYKVLRSGGRGVREWTVGSVPDLVKTFAYRAVRLLLWVGFGTWVLRGASEEWRNFGNDDVVVMFKVGLATTYNTVEYSYIK